MNKKSITVIVRNIVIGSIILYIGSFLICKYIDNKSHKNIYLNIFSSNYGSTDNGTIIDKNSLSYFDGEYTCIKQQNIDSIINERDSVNIYLSENSKVKELYVIYPEMKVYTLYDDLVYELTSYSDSLLSYLQNLYLEINDVNYMD